MGGREDNKGGVSSIEKRRKEKKYSQKRHSEKNMEKAKQSLKRLAEQGGTPVRALIEDGNERGSL